MACTSLPGRNFAPFEEVKVPVSNSAEIVPKSAPWRMLQDLAWLGLSISTGKYSSKNIIKCRTE